MYVCTAGSQWRLRLWSNRWLHVHGKGYLLQILFHAADNIPCHVHVNIQTDNQKIELGNYAKSVHCHIMSDAMKGSQAPVLAGHP